MKNVVPLFLILLLLGGGAGLAPSLHGQLAPITNITSATVISPKSTPIQNPNWSPRFTSLCSESFTAVSSSAMVATTGVSILNFEVANNFPAATNPLSASAQAFAASSGVAPYLIANAVSSITTAAGYNVGVQSRTFNLSSSLLNAPDPNQGIFLAADDASGNTMASGSQGLVAGSIASANPDGASSPGGALFSFDRNLSQFGVVLKANSGSVTDVIILFDSNGVMIAKYSEGIAAGSSLYFGVKSPSSLIRTVWVGQQWGINGLVIDDVSFVPGPAPAQNVSYSFQGAGALTGWSVSPGCTCTTNATYLTLAASNDDSNIYRSITLPAGTYTITGTGTGILKIETMPNWSSPNPTVLNLNQASGWRTDSTTFTTTGGSRELLVGVNGSNGDSGSIQSLTITSTTPTPYTIDTGVLKTQTAALPRTRGMVDDWNGTTIQDPHPASYFTGIKNWGGNVVRLQFHPMTYYADNTSTFSSFWSAWQSYLTNVIVPDVQNAQTAGIKVIIDLHEMPVPITGSQNPWTQPDLNADFGSVWQDIAQAMITQGLTSTVWGYEIVNEPLDENQMPNPPRQWLPAVINTIQTIRSIEAQNGVTTPAWIVFDVGPGGEFSGFNNLTPLPDSHVIYSAHCYDPYTFTYQGLPNCPQYPAGVRYATATGLSGIVTYLQPAVTFQQQWPVPIYVGEFATDTYVTSPDGANWLNDVISLFNGEGWSWSYFEWGANATFALYLPSSAATYSLPGGMFTDRGLLLYDAMESADFPAITPATSTGTGTAPERAPTYQNPNWSSYFVPQNGCTEAFTATSVTTLNATPGLQVLNFETGNGFAAASNSLSTSGTVFTNATSITPFNYPDSISHLETATGSSVSLSYCTFDPSSNTLGNPDTSQGVFLVSDYAGGTTMASGSQGVIAGCVSNSVPGGVLLDFDHNLADFAVTLNAHAAGSPTYIVALYDDNGTLIATYKMGVASNSSLYFGVKSPNAIIRKVWIGQKYSINGVVIDDISFVPGS